MTAESEGERILKTSQYLPKLWTIKWGVIFYETPCSYSYSYSLGS